MKNVLNKVGAQIEMKKQAVIAKVKGFMTDETSAKGSSEEGYLVYAGIVIGIIVLAIGVAFMTDSFTDIGNFFQDGINGNVTNPDGWGN